MNWFDILKNAGLAQSQRQGISARQKDEDFVFEDDDDDCKTWFNTLVNMINDFFKELESKGEYTNVGFDLTLKSGNIPDEVYCAVREKMNSVTEEEILGHTTFDLNNGYKLSLDFYDQDHFNFHIDLRPSSTNDTFNRVGIGAYWFKDFGKDRPDRIEEENRTIEFLKKLGSHIGPNNKLTEGLIYDAEYTIDFMMKDPYNRYDEDGSFKGN